MDSSMVELIRIAGFGGAMLVVWLITVRFLKSLIDAFQEQINRMMETSAQQHKTDFEFLNNQHIEDFKVLEKFARGIEYLGGEAAEMNQLILTHQHCPVTRKATQSNG